MTTCHCCVELLDLQLTTRIGTYGPTDTVPERHTLDLVLTIQPEQVLIATDDMASVFDYDPLVADIDRLARACHYQTQERLMTRIASACARYPAIQGLDMRLRKQPVLANTGSLGIRLVMDANALAALRDSPV